MLSVATYHISCFTCHMQITYGHGGWIRLDDTDMPGPLYLRYRSDSGRPVLTEFYLDGRGREIPSGLFRTLDLAGVTALAMRGEGAWLESSARQAGPDLSRLASSFGTIYGGGTYAGRHCQECNAPLRRGKALPSGEEQALTDWVALSWFSQFPKSKIPQPRRVSEPKPQEEMSAPTPVRAPSNGLTNEFLQSVADNYVWAVMCRQRPAPMIEAQSGCPVRTVRSWIMKARARGILAPTTRGKVG
jgi:hypothetical protein